MSSLAGCLKLMTLAMHHVFSRSLLEFTGGCTARMREMCLAQHL